jgi:uncharacterized protein with PQ loop repeat
VITAFAVVAAVTVVLSVAPQVLRVVRAEDVCGVSTTAATFAAVSCGAWTVYALLAGHHVAAASSALGIVMWGTVAGVAARRNGESPSTWTLTWGAVLLTAGVVDVAVLGAVLVIEALTYTLPQALRVRRRTDGVSPATWLLTLVSACSWVLYGAGTGDPVLAVANGMKAAVAGSIVAELRRRAGGRHDGRHISHRTRTVRSVESDPS